MVIYFLIIFILYYFFVLLLIFGWVKIEDPQSSQKPVISGHFASIVVAVRNEAKNIIKLLSSLESQNYSTDLFEVVIVDDQSTDNTAEIVRDFQLKSRLNIKFLSSDVGGIIGNSPKKYALSLGIQSTEGDIIVTTDGDCWMGAAWLKNMISPFVSESILFVSGPVVIQPKHSFFSKIQTLEFSSLIGSGASLINLNYPLMCNGANLAFRKKAFEEVNGYKWIDHTASGDDVFLMQKIFHRFKNSIVFNKSTEAIVFTEPADSIYDLINQRRRWASKWNNSRLTLSWLLPVFLFLHYLFFLALIIIPFFQHSILGTAFALIAIKFIIDYFFLKKVIDFCKLRMSIGVFLVSELLYPVYAIGIGIVVHFGKWLWKGRTHKK